MASSSSFIGARCLLLVLCLTLLYQQMFAATLADNGIRTPRVNARKRCYRHRHATRAVRVKRDTSAEFCSWLATYYGYGCDGPVERWLWEKYNRFVRGVTDCNSLCVWKGYTRGKCVDGSTDRSTWCPPGQHCRCFKKRCGCKKAKTKAKAKATTSTAIQSTTSTPTSPS